MHFHFTFNTPDERRFECNSENKLVVTTGHDYLHMLLGSAAAVDQYYNDKNNQKKIDLIYEIVSLQTSYYIARRTRGLGSDTCDTISTLERKLVKRYEKLFGKFVDFNKDVEW